MPWRRRRLGAWWQEGGQIRSCGTGDFTGDLVVRIPDFHYHGLGSILGRGTKILTKKREKEAAVGLLGTGACGQHRHGLSYVRDS